MAADVTPATERTNPERSAGNCDMMSGAGRRRCAVQTGDAGSSGASTWPFVGRTHELSACRQGLADQRGAVIFGDGGVGKTRLAQELSAEVASGARWHRISGSRGVSAVAFGAWAHLLPASWAGDLDDVAAWRALADHLRSGDGSIHLFVDDAHWLDLGSA